MNKIVEIIKQLENTSSTNDKIKILKSNKDNELLQRVLEYTLNPYKKYKITEKTLIEGKCKSNFDDIFKLLDTLSKSNINDLLRLEVNAFLGDTEDLEIRELYKRMLLKDLKCNISSKTVNKVWEGLIPTSSTGVDVKCMLGSKVDFSKPPHWKTMFCSEKIDGSRCIAIIKDDSVELYSRQGHLIEGCKDIEQGLLSLGINNAVLDGEITAKDVDIFNTYKETMKRLRNKKEVKYGLQYNVFDYLELEEFENKRGKYKYSERRSKLDKLISNDFVKVLPILYQGNDFNEVIKVTNSLREKGSEGAMINNDAFYEFKRSKNLLKIKVMDSVDLKVIGFEKGQGAFSNTLGCAIVDYKGNKVGVGSGWSLEDRKEIWDNQDKYLGKLLEVQYFEETINSDSGLPSLRFPVALRWRFDKEDPSYN